MEELTYHSELEDEGIIIQPVSDDIKFPLSYKLKVEDVTSQKKQEIVEDLLKGNTDRDVVSIYDVQLLNGTTKIQPNGKIKVRIPITEGLKNPSLLIETKDGELQAITAVEEDGYYVYETDYLGLVCVLTETGQPNTPSHETSYTKKPDANTGGIQKPITSTKNSYTKDAQGKLTGTETGDPTNILLYIGLSCLSLMMLNVWNKRRVK